MNKQYGVILFRRNSLLEYMKMDLTPLEIIESVDMLRILEHGMKVLMILTNYNIFNVDTPDELRQVEKFMQDLPPL
jgi:3-deoxy-manno-octulosonate cytidylyltransferase (CMP-KDO synthetase)